MTGVVSPGRTHPGATPTSVAAGATVSGAVAVNPRNVAEIVVGPVPDVAVTPMGKIQGVPLKIRSLPPPGKARECALVRTIPAALDERSTGKSDV